MKIKNLLITLSFCVLITQTGLSALLTATGDLTEDVGLIQGGLGGVGSIMDRTNDVYTSLGDPDTGTSVTVTSRVTTLRSKITGTAGASLAAELATTRAKVTAVLGTSLDTDLTAALADVNDALNIKGVGPAATLAGVAGEIDSIVTTGIPRTNAILGLGLTLDAYNSITDDFTAYTTALNDIEALLGGTATDIYAQISDLQTLIGGTGLSLHARITALLAEVSG